MNLMKCEYCKYGWKRRKKNPISCPRCKKRFDNPYKEILKEIEEDRVKEDV